MLRVLILIGNKVLVSGKGEVLIPFEDMSETSLAEALQRQYAVNTIRMDSIPDWNFCAVTAASQKGMHPKLVSIAGAIKKIEAHEWDIRKYLDEQRRKLSIKLQYGVRDGKIVHISEISDDQSGLICNCTCPGCGMPLQARIGKKKQKHFAHNNAKCDPSSAQQTALHLLAKEIIEEEKQILVPGVTVKKHEIAHLINKDLIVYFEYTRASWEYKSAKTVKCSSVLLEKRVSDIIPDIVINVAGRTCLVEIAVTHFVDEEKRLKVKELGLPLFEIDLRSLYGSELTRERIRDAVLYGTENRRWIYNPIKEQAKEWAASQYNAEAQNILDQRRLEKQRYEEKERRKQQQREEAQRKIEYLFLPNIYKKTLETLRNDKKAFAGLKRLFCYREFKDSCIPFYLDIPITGEFVFLCDRRIWQSKLFDTFIYNRKAEDSTVNLKKVEKWLDSYQKEIPIDWTIAQYRVEIELCDSTSINVRLISDVVKRFFGYMSTLGFLSPFFGYEATVKQPHTIIPPNIKAANRLEAILCAVDTTAPTIDVLVHQALHLRVTRWDLSHEEITSAVNRVQLAGKIALAERNLCFEQIKYADFEGDNPVADKLGSRWFVCTDCGNICREDEMGIYGGFGKVNKGHCKKCLNNR